MLIQQTEATETLGESAFGQTTVQTCIFPMISTEPQKVVL